MTMMDEETLRSALAAAAEEFDVSHDAIARILDEARVDEPERTTRRVRALVPASRRARVLIYSVAALIVATAIAIPLMRGETPRPTYGALRAPNSSSPSGTTGLITVSGAQAISAPKSGDVTNKTLYRNVTGTGATTKIESNGFVNLSVGVGKVPNAINQLTALVDHDHGYVESSEARVGSHAAGSFATGTVVLEVPQPTFAHLVSQVQGVGHTTSVNTTSNNVTSQYVDRQSQIAALNVSLHQYFVIMTRATTIGEILAVQTQINNIQSQIQQQEGQLKVLNSETTYSALTVNLTSGAHRQASGPRTGFNKAWHDSVSGFIAGFQWLLRLAGPLLFALVLLGVLYVLFRSGRRALLRRKLQ
jgi:hypothetical protein